MIYSNDDIRRAFSVGSYILLDNKSQGTISKPSKTVMFFPKLFDNKYGLRTNDCEGTKYEFPLMNNGETFYIGNYWDKGDNTPKEDKAGLEPGEERVLVDKHLHLCAIITRRQAQQVTWRVCKYHIA